MPVEAMAGATISGTTSVCQNDPKPSITFTGSGGTAPYTFIYKINGGTSQTCVTTSGNSITVLAPTTSTGIFVYSLVSVSDVSGVPQAQGGSATVTVNVMPDTTLTSNFTADVLNGTPVFKTCTNTGNSEITATNSSSTTSTNSTYTIDWGDGKPVLHSTGFTNQKHVYNTGVYTLTFTITGNTGCISVKTYKVFVSSNPGITLGNNGGTDICVNDSLSFPISGTSKNPPGTIYTIVYGDGSPNEVYNDTKTLPALVTHTFKKSSCAITTSDGIYLNAFSVNIVAVNNCGTSQSTVEPIYVSAPPKADFMCPPQPAYCANKPVCIDNTSTGAAESTAGGCNVVPIVVWKISPVTFSLTSGTLGLDNGSTYYKSWTPGSNTICPSFNTPGTYTITMLTGNRCGIDSITKTIKVEASPVLSFTVDFDKFDGCAPFSTTVNNTSNTVSTTTPTAYNWSVTYSPGSWGLTSSWAYIGGKDSTSLNPSFKFTNPGIYTLTLTVTNSCGSYTLSKTIIVKKPPIVSIKAISNSCGTASITPVAVINGGGSSLPLTYAWSFPGGNPTASTAQNPGTITYNSTGSYKVSLSVTNECGSTKDSTSFKVNPIPTVDIIPDQTKCKGTNSDLITFTGTVAGTTYNWTNTNTSTGLAASGTGNINPFLLKNTGTTNLVTTITVTPTITATGCTGTPIAFKITVYPTAVVNALTNKTFCNKDVSPVVTFSGAVAGTTYTWTNSTPAIGLTANGAGNLPGFTTTNTGTTLLVATITVIPSANGCSGTPQIFTITVNPTPTVVKPVNQLLCNGTKTTVVNFTGSVTPTVYNWTNDNTSIGLSASGTGDIPPFTVVNNGLVPITANITVTPTANGCNGSPQTFIITVNPTPAINFSTGNQIVCSGSQTSVVDLKSNLVGATISWTAATPVGITGVTTSGTNQIPVQTLINSTFNPIVVSYSVTADSNNGLICKGFSTYTITVNPIPVVPGVLADTICNGNAFTIVPLNGNGNVVPPGTTYTWSTPVILPAGSITGVSSQSTPQTSISQTLTNKTNQLVTATYTVNLILGNCTNNSFNVVVTVNPKPKVKFSLPNQLICSGDATSAVALLSTTGGNVSYNWASTVPAGISGASLSGTNSIPVQNLVNSTSNPLTIKYSAVATINNGTGCPGDTAVYSITVKPVPIVNLTGNVVLCNNEKSGKITFGANIPGTTFVWTNDTPAIGLAANGNDSIPAFTASNPGVSPIVATISVTPSVNGCSGISSTFTITVNPTPTVNLPENQNICNGFPTSAINFSGNIPTTTYLWTNDHPAIGLAASGTGNISSFTAQSNDSVPVTAKITVTPTTDKGCNGSPKTFTITVNPTPVLVSQPVSTTVCQNGTPNILSVTTKFGTGLPHYQWFSNTLNNTSGTLIPGATNSTFTPPTSTVGATYYYCIISYPEGGCAGLTSNVAVVTVNSLPTITIQPKVLQLICEGGTITAPLSVSFLGGLGMATYQWFSNATNINSGGTNISGAKSSDFTPTAFPTVGKYYYYVEITMSGTGCGSVASNVAEIDVLPDPVVEQQPLVSQTLCPSGTPVDLSVKATGGVGTYIYQWFSNIANNATSGSLIAGATNQNFTPPTSSIGTMYYYCEISQLNGSGCNVTSETAAVIVNPIPTITSQPQSSTICQNGIATTLSVIYINGVGSPTYQWYSNTIDDTSSGTPISSATSQTFNPPTSIDGTTYYYCKITLSIGGCSVMTSATASVLVHSLPTITTQPKPTQSICEGGSIAFPLTIAYSGGFGSGSIQWYSNTTNSTTGGTMLVGEPNLTYNPPVFTTTGNYYYYAEVTMTGIGCGSVVSDVAEIVVLPDPVVTAQPVVSQEICQNAVSQDLTVIVTGGVGAFLYQWYRNTTNNNTSGTLINGATKQIYTPQTSNIGITYYYCVITQFGGSGCGVTSETVEVSVNINPTINTQPVSSIICQFSMATPLSVSYQSGVGTPAYQWYYYTIKNSPGIVIPGAIDSVYNPLTNKLGTTYYYCIITFPTGGCNVLTSDIAQVTTRVTASISAYNREICSGGTFSVTPANGNVVPFGTTYTWSAPNINPVGSITGGQEEQAFQTEISQTLVNKTSFLATATYTVTPTNGTCDGVPFLVTVKVNPLIIPNAIILNNTCANGKNASIQTKITGGIAPYTISWSGPNGFTSDSTSISGLASGKYYLDITEKGGCPFSTSYDITEPSKIQINNFSKKDVTCNGANDGEIILSISGGTPNYTVKWTKNSIAFADTTAISHLGTGTYIVSVTDTNKCEPVSQTYVITEPPVLTIDVVKQDIKCFGDNSGAITINVTGGTTFALSPGVFGYHYNWRGPNGFTSTIQNLQNLKVGTYNLTVTDKSGCSKTYSATITQPVELIATADTKQISCNGTNDASIAVTASGGMPPYRIVWSNFATGWSQSNLSASEYTAIVLDANDCQKTLKVTIREPHIYFINPVVKNISCNGAHNGSIHLNLQGGTPPISIKWSESAASGSVRNNLGLGTYIVTISDASPCVLTQSFVVVEPQQLGITASVKDAFDCNDANSGSISLLVANGTPPYSYLWSNGLTTRDITNLSGGDYSVTVTDAGGCPKSEIYSIKRQQPIKIAVATGPNYNCATKKVDMICIAEITGGIPPYKTSWSSGKVRQDDNKIMVTDQIGVVILNVTDAMGCNSNYSFDVSIPKYGITYQLINCASYAFQFNVDLPTLQTNNSYLWDFGDGGTSTKKITDHQFPSSGSYTIKLSITTTSCVINYEETIIVEKEPVLKLDRAPKFCKGDSVVVHVSGAKFYRWAAGSVSDSMTIKRAGEFSVSGVSNSGCMTTLKFNASYNDLLNYTIQSDQNDVIYDGTPLKVWSQDIPLSQYYWDFGDGFKESGNNLSHVYSASNDGYFDIKLQVINPNGCLEETAKRFFVASPAVANTFTPNGDGKNDVFMKDWHIKVYNRNGILMSDGFGWDGNYKGRLAANDTYFFVLYYTSDSGMKAKSGYVTLIR